ncbi:LPD38 domain-containing protein [Comamonas sp. MYb21]|uniref:LPD38 domain-containing protein n=1 Tax=Comamonas sp. MYb21 TaxID=1848648 RepID=UPI00309B2EEF
MNKSQAGSETGPWSAYGGLKSFDGKLDGEKDTGGVVSDLAKSVKVGVQRLPGMAAGLADLPIAAVSGARPVTAAADAIGKATGFQPGKWADETKFSAGHEQGRKAVDEAWEQGDVGSIAKAYLQNPGYTAGQVAESLPGMVTGGLVGRALMGAGAAAAAGNAAGGAARAAVPGYLERAVGQKLAVPIAAGAGEGAITAGQQMAQYEGDDQQKNALASLGAGVGTGVLGAVGGRLANKLGLETAETAIVNAGKGRLAEGAGRSLAGRVAGGMVSEAVLQELPQSTQEQMWQNYAEGKDIWDGVARAGVEGAIAGGVMGAGANIRGRRTEGEHANDLARDAAASANGLAEDAQNQPAPLMLGNAPPDQMVSFPDGSVGRRGEVESYLANLPEDQREQERLRLMGQQFTEVNDLQAQQARRWWENYGEDGARAQRPDYLAEVQQAVRSGTPFSTQETVDTVRSAMEDAWLQQHVQAEATPESAAAPAQAADAIGQQLQAEFDQAGQDAAVAAVDARVRTGRVLTGLQNVLDAGADNSLQVLSRLNDSLVRIGEDPLQPGEVARVRRMTDAYMGFKGAGEAAPLPSAPRRLADMNADNAAMESLIPERQMSERMGLNPAAGPLSRAAVTAVDGAANAQASQGSLARAAQSIPAARALPVEAAGPAPVSQPVGAALVPQTDQAQQVPAQRPQTAGAQAVQPEPAGLNDGSATPQNTGTQTTPAPSAQSQAAPAAQEVAAQAPARPENWRSSMLRAAPVARALGIETRGKRLAEVVAEVDAADAQRTGVAPADTGRADEGFATSNEGSNNDPTTPDLRVADVGAQGANTAAADGRSDAASSQAAGQPAAQPARGQRADAREPGASVPEAVPGRSGTGESAANLNNTQTEAAQFSRGTPGMTPELAAAIMRIKMPATVDTVRAAVRDLVGGLGTLPNRLGRVVVATSAEIRQTWEPLIGPVAMEAAGDTGRAQGFYDPKTKTVFLIADHIQRGQEAGVVAHELMHKHGEAVLGAEGWQQLHGMIEGWASAPEGSMEQRVYSEAQARVQSSMPEGAQQQQYSSQELFPYAVQVALEMGVRPNLLAQPGTVARWLGQVRAALRQVWAKITGKPGQFEAQDMVNLAFGIAQRENPEHAGELDGSIAPLRTATNFLQARQAVKEFQGSELTNASTGMTAVLARNSLDKMLSGKAVAKSETPATHAMAVANADSLFERAILGWSKEDRAGDPNIRAIHRFFAPLDVDGRTKLVKLTVKESVSADRQNPLYTIEAVELNEKMPGDAWLEAAAREDGVSLDEKSPLQRGVGRQDDQQAGSRATLTSPHGFTPGDSAEDLRSLAQEVERRNSAPSQAPDKAEPPKGSGGEGVQFSRAATATITDNYNPSQKQAAEKAFGAVAKQTVAERAKEMRSNLGTKLRQGLVDQFAPIKEVSEKAYMLARLSKGSDGAVEAALLYGKPFLKDGVADVNIQDGGFAKVLASLKGEHDRFFQWVAAQRAERLKAEGKENLLTDQNISALKSLNAGTFEDGTPRMPAYSAALRELNAFNEAGLKIAKESGLIDQAAMDLMKDQPYVPFYRLMEDGDIKGARFSSGLINQQAFKKLKGGNQQINADLLQNTLLNWGHLYAAAARNRAALATMKDAEGMGIAYQVPADTKGAVKVMRDGVTEHWMIEDPYLLDAVSALHYTPSKLAQGMAPFKRLLTMGVTINPTFKIRNLIRDSLSAMAQSDLGYNPFANVAQGWKAMDKNSQTQASMLASGGIIKFGTQEDTGALRRKIDKLGGTMLDKDGFGKLKSQMASLWETYEEFGDRTENANRAALYERLIAKGHSHAEASFMARDLMDFSMSGKWEMVRFLTQTVPFLNARIQGLYKLGRAAAEDPKRFGAIAGAVSLASLGLLAAYQDDEDWKKRDDWDRDSYWWFKIGNQAFRIPKPFEVGSIGTMAERTAELMFSKEMTGKRFSERLSDMIFNTFAMDPTPQAVKPLLDVYANKDSFSGKAIEGFADERLRPQDRYSDRTSEVARLLGSWGLPDPVKLAKGDYSALSPKQIDFLMRGYTGWLSTVFTTATDTVLRPMMGRGDRPEMQMRDVFLAGNFVENLPTNSSRYVSTMYDQAREISQVWASYQAAVKSGDADGAAKIRAANPEALAKRIPVEAAKTRVAELSQQAKKVEGDRLMSAEAKRRRLDEIAAQKDAIAKRLATL